jgi:hypothetical protein
MIGRTKESGNENGKRKRKMTRKLIKETKMLPVDATSIRHHSYR